MVGVMGEGRTYESVCALRAVTSVDPQAWYADVLSSIADTPQSRLRELVPWNWKTSRLSRAA
jgi:transposase